MSLEAAAAALGIPESLVQRSAEARSAETGASVDDIIAGWAGDAPPPVVATTAPDPATEAVEAETAVEETTPEVTIEVPDTAPAEPVAIAAEPYKPPILVGAKDNPMMILAGVIGLFLIVMLVGLVGPSIAFEEPGTRSSEIPYSQSAVDGQHVYGSLGCAACHTQVVRPVVADVGLGAVTLNDTNQTIGTRRFGPDLSNVGARVSGTQMQAIVEGRLGNHPSHSLSESDMSDLVAYLSQSVTAEASG